MKFQMTVQREEGGEPWREDYDKPAIRTLEQARDWSTKTVAWFNSTLHPQEKARKLIDVVEVKESRATAEHEWRKTNLMTIISRGRVYDTARCEVCGVTGKRFGLGDVKLDSKYRAKKYKICNGEGFRRVN